MSTRQAKITRGRPLLLDTANINGAPENGYETPEESTPLQTPHHVMSPRCLPGMRTTGLIIGLSEPALNVAIAQPGGFELVLWVASPSGYLWYRCTSVFLNFRDASVTFDINAFPLYVQIEPTSVATDGGILFNFMEV